MDDQSLLLEMTTKKVTFGYRFPDIPDHLEYEDELPSSLAVDPNDQPIEHLRGITIAEIDKIWHSHSDACWSLVIRLGIDYCVECEKPATKIVQHPWTQFKAANPMVGALVTPVCGEACQKQAFYRVRENWTEDMRQWVEDLRRWTEGEPEEGPTHAPGTKMKDVKFTFIFPTGQQSLVYTHPLPARLCANADDKNNKQVQRALQEELRHVSRIRETECEDTLRGIACDVCGASGRHIMQMPLASLNMPVPIVGVTVLPVCGQPKCATAIRQGTEKTMQDMRKLFSPMYGQHSPVLTMLRCDSCGDWGKMRKCQRCHKVAYCDRECQRAAWSTHKAVCTA